MSNTSTIHIKTDFDCKVYDYGQELGSTKADTYFNIELRKGEHELMFVFLEDNTITKTINYTVEEAECDYRLVVEIAETLFEIANDCEKKHDDTSALVLYKKAAEKGYAKAQTKLGYILWNGSGYMLSGCDYYYASIDWSDDKDVKEAFAWFAKAAEQGDAEAQYRIGQFYSEGIGVKEDDIKAIEWYTKAANQGYIAAQNQLGCWYDRCKNHLEAFKWYTKAAEQGNAGAQYNLGLCYQYGKGVVIDYSEAVEWYIKAANQGHYSAQHTLAECYENGLGVDKCMDKAMEWYSKSAEHSFSYEEQLTLGKRYEYGNGVEKCLYKAVEWYTKAAINSGRRLSSYLFDCYFHDWSDYDITKALEWYKNAAEKGIKEAQLVLFVCYQEGRGVKKDKTQADLWLDKAAAQGGAWHFKKLGDRYQTGNGVTKDIQTAIECYAKAAELGDHATQYLLGLFYYNGEYVEKNSAKSVELFTKAAEGNDLCQAQYYLGICYESGEGVEKDFEKAVEWYTKAAEQGVLNAQYRLGLCYEYGKGVTKDLQKAIGWYTKAAEPKLMHDGEANAQYHLGYCFEKGIGVTKDIAKALEWYSLSSEQGNEEAQKALDRLKPNKIKPIKYLFFDTETTGVPRDNTAPTTDSRNWPRLVQLSWIMTDDDCNIISKSDHVIYPDGFVIPSDAARLHGITTNIARVKGEPLEVVIDKFMDDFNKAETIVGHNIAFDKNIIGAELVRLGQKDIMNSKHSICTMKYSTDFCRIPGRDCYKWPTLQELHKKLFGCEFEDAHNSMSDVTATLKCFKEMMRVGLIYNEP